MPRWTLTLHPVLVLLISCGGERVSGQSAAQDLGTHDAGQPDSRDSGGPDVTQTPDGGNDASADGGDGGAADSGIDAGDAGVADGPMSDGSDGGMDAGASDGGADGGADDGGAIDGAIGDGGDGGPTSGCGNNLTPGMTEESITVNGTPRAYLRVIPDAYDPSQPYPLVFAWHGLGGDGALARLYFGVEQASADQAIFLYPDGLPQAAHGGETGWDLSAGGDDMLFFDALLDELYATACIDLDRVFSTGHSFGCYMSNALSCFRGTDIAAIGAVAGGPYFGLSCSGTTGAWLAHDQSDSVVPFSEGEAARDQHLGRNGCDATTTPTDPSPCVAYDGCAADTPVHWCDHTDGGANGHGWPGWAGSAIWSFFATF